MPTQQERNLAHSILDKIIDGEQITIEDAARWGSIITIPPQIAHPTIEQVKEVEFKIRSGLKQVYFPQQPQPQ